MALQGADSMFTIIRLLLKMNGRELKWKLKLLYVVYTQTTDVE